MNTELDIIGYWHGTPMHIIHSYKWQLTVSNEYYNGRLTSTPCYDTEADAYDALMESQGDDAIYTLLNCNICIDNYKLKCINNAENTNG